jgi:hypothetical protein
VRADNDLERETGRPPKRGTKGRTCKRACSKLLRRRSNFTPAAVVDPSLSGLSKSGIEKKKEGIKMAGQHTASMVIVSASIFVVLSSKEPFVSIHGARKIGPGV